MPILAAVTMIVVGVLLSLVYPVFNAGLTAARATPSTPTPSSAAASTAPRTGCCIPLGLHHILNSVVWFILGDYNGVHGDLNRFFAGDPTAGTFMTGFFPIMMFALPAAALAIWHEARPEQRKVVGGIMLSVALTAFLTGITEPLEFAFSSSPGRCTSSTPCSPAPRSRWSTPWASTTASRSPPARSTTSLNFGQATRPLWLIPIGLGYAVVYYVVFRFVIRRWNLRTPGRELENEHRRPRPPRPPRPPSRPKAA